MKELMTMPVVKATLLRTGFLILTLSALAASQPAVPDTVKPSELPGTVINDKAVALQTSIYPTVYQDSTATTDMKWLVANDTDLVRFWHLNGDSILSSLSVLSGVTWTDETLTLYFVRYYPSLGSAEPIILPINGIKLGPVTEAVPRGAVTEFNLIFLLAQRILLEGAVIGTPSAPILSTHPLMNPGPYFRDNLALLLAYSVGQKILGADSTKAAYNSPFFKKRLPGRDLFERFFKDKWTLMADKPLTLYLTEEEPDSKIVTSAYSMAANPVNPVLSKKMSIEGLPDKGQLGFSIRLNNANQLVVDNIDTTHIAYQAGLRKGDVIRSVNGQRPKSHRDLIEDILDNLESGATIQVTRNDRGETVFLRSKS